MNKTELIAAVAEKTGVPKKTAEGVVDAMIKTTTETLAAGDDVSLRGFGAFSIRNRSARTGRNPSTGAAIQIKASNSVHFAAAQQLRALVAP